MIQPHDHMDILLVRELLLQLRREDPRKATISDLIYQGFTISQIARRLGLSATTVKTCWKQAKELMLRYMQSEPNAVVLRASSAKSSGVLRDRRNVLESPIRTTKEEVTANRPNSQLRSGNIRPPWVEVEADAVPGLRILRLVIGPEYQQALVKLIDADPRWEPDFSRFRRWYAYQYRYKSDVLIRDGDGSLPPWVFELVKFAHDQKWINSLAEQVTIQKYGCGSSIASHVDSRKCFPGEIATVSLVGEATYRMSDTPNRRRFTTVLEPGDVVVLRGDARNLWKHEILKCKPADDEDAASWYRLSITLRNINPERVRQ